MAVSLNGDGTITGLSTLDSVTITGLTSLTTTDLIADTTTLVVDSANNRVGIGTSSPSAPLTIQRNGTTISGIDGSTVLSLQSTGSSGSSTHLNILSGSTGSTGQSVITFGDADDPDITAIRHRNADNSLAFETSSTERMRIASSGNVGIGTSSPSYLLHINGGYLGINDGSNRAIILNTTSDGSDTGDFLACGGGSASVTRGGYFRAFGNEHATNAGEIDIQAGNVSGSLIKFGTSGGVERMRIDSAGNVGIGTTSPTQAGLVINKIGTDSNTSARIALKSNETSANTYMRFGRFGTGDDAGMTIGNNYNRDGGSYSADYSSYGVSDIIFGDGQLSFGTGAAGATNPTTRMTIDSSGNVGIGTSAAGYGDLTVLRQATTATNATLSLVSGTSGYGRLFFGDTQNAAGEYDGFIQYDQANRLMQFGTAQAERMRITSTGDVAIGTSTASGKLKVSQGSSADCNINFEAFTANYAVNLSLIGNNALGSKFNNIVSKYGSTEQWYIGGAGVDATLAFKTGGSERMRIDSSGNVLIGTTSTSGPSSAIVVGGIFRTQRGSGTAQASTSQTLFTITTDTTYLVTVQTPNASGLSVTALVHYVSGGNAPVVTTLKADNGGFIITLSGTNVRITNNLGGVVGYVFNAVRIF